MGMREGLRPSTATAGDGSNHILRMSFPCGATFDVIGEEGIADKHLAAGSGVW